MRVRIFQEQCPQRRRKNRSVPAQHFPLRFKRRMNYVRYNVKVKNKIRLFGGDDEEE